MLTQRSKLRSISRPTLQLAVATAALAILGACGGSGEEAAFQDMSTQQLREKAALKRAHQINSEVMSKNGVKHERAAQPAQSN